MAISCPGRIDTKKGIIYNGGRVPFLHQVSLKDIIEEHFTIPCAVSNDAKAGLLAELWKGNLQNIENGAIIVLGTAIGGGIVINGQPLQGSHFQAGEFSLLLREAGKPQISGISGSAVRLIQKAAAIVGLEDQNDGLAVFEVIHKENNAEVLALFEKFCMEIAHVISNLQVTLDLDKVVIGGGISEQAIVLEGIRKQYNRIREENGYLKRSFSTLTIDVCQFKNNANLIGAAYPILLKSDSKGLE